MQRENARVVAPRKTEARHNRVNNSSGGTWREKEWEDLCSAHGSSNSRIGVDFRGPLARYLGNKRRTKKRRRKNERVRNQEERGILNPLIFQEDREVRRCAFRLLEGRLTDLFLSFFAAGCGFPTWVRTGWVNYWVVAGKGWINILFCLMCDHVEVIKAVEDHTYRKIVRF